MYYNRDQKSIQRYKKKHEDNHLNLTYKTILCKYILSHLPDYFHVLIAIVYINSNQMLTPKALSPIL